MGFRHAISRLGRLAAAALIALSSVVPPAGAQNLLPPSLPPTLPGGVPLPGLPAGSQGDILQRILDAAGGRAPASGDSVAPPAYTGAPPAGRAPSPFPMPGAPPAGPLPADPGEPLSNTEAFFAARGPLKKTFHQRPL